ncbi:MAG: phosphoketolase [Cyanobacteria bacterium P01_F01_bin.42]
MTLASSSTPTLTPDFCDGIRYFGESWPEFEQLGQKSAIASSAASGDRAFAYQTLLAADALRYLVLQMTASKASGHPGGFASCVEAYAAFLMLGHKNFLTEVGHHAPGFYSAMFMDQSLEAMGIKTVTELCERFRERDGLLGHLSGQIPGLLGPAGPLGQGQHFAMAGALLHRDTLFPFTLGDGGLGEPYVMSSMGHFHTAYPDVTNFLPVLAWNGYSQEHHSMVSTQSNETMIAFWKAQGFENVILVDAKDYDQTNQPGAYIDSTAFDFEQRLTFAQAVVAAADEAAKAALSGTLTVMLIKQLKGAGVHARGAKSHNLYAYHTLDNPDIVSALQARALSPEAWALVRENLSQAGGGPAAKTVVTESILTIPDLGTLPLEEFAVGGDPQVATTAMGKLVATVGERDRQYLVTNADGNAASGIGNINQALKIIHPTADPDYFQQPGGQVYEPLSEDACAGLASGLALMGSRSLWCSYESFAINGLPILQTVTQAMAELRRPTPSVVTLFTAGALEQGRNGWTHQRPEVEAYFAAMMRNGNIFPIFPADANCIQVAYDWALGTRNKGVIITASKSPLPVRVTLDQARTGIEQGALILKEATPNRQTLVLAVVGDMTLAPALAAAKALEDEGLGVRVVSVMNPRRLYRTSDVAWSHASEADGQFLSDQDYEKIFGGDGLIGVTGGASGMLEPIMLRSMSQRDVIAWKRGETTSSAGELMAYNGITEEAIAQRGRALMARS